MAQAWRQLREALRPVCFDYRIHGADGVTRSVTVIAAVTQVGGGLVVEGLVQPLSMPCTNSWPAGRPEVGNRPARQATSALHGFHRPQRRRRPRGQRFRPALYRPALPRSRRPVEPTSPVEWVSTYIACYAHVRSMRPLERRSGPCGARRT